MSETRTVARNWRIDAAGLVIVAGLAYLVIWVGYRPLYDSYRSYESLSAARDDALLNHTRMAAAVGLVGERVDEARNELAASPLHFRSRSHLNLQLATITELAESAGLSADHTQADRQVVTGHMHDAISISVSATGTFDACSKFLRDLSDDLPDVAVSTLEISPRGEAGEALTLRLRLLWYIQPDQSTEDAQASP